MKVVDTDPRGEFIEEPTETETEETEVLVNPLSNYTPAELIAEALNMVEYLNKEVNPCRENFFTILKLEEALLWNKKFTENFKSVKNMLDKSNETEVKDEK